MTHPTRKTVYGGRFLWKKRVDPIKYLKRPEPCGCNNINRSGTPKVAFFFSRNSSWLTHSLKIEKTVFFFRKSGRKKKHVFFFSQEKFTGHFGSLTRLFKNISIPFFCFFPLYRFFFCKSDSLTKFQFLSQIDRFFHGHYQLSCLNI